MLPVKNIVEKIEKGWGYELILINKEYCGKILHFNKNSKMSMHFHMKKNETWYILDGEFIFRWIDTNNAKIVEDILRKGDSITISEGLPHQLETIEGGELFEVSTHHYDNDSYRVFSGNSQTIN